MTQPTPTYTLSPEDEKAKRFLERGAKTVLRVEKRFSAETVRHSTVEPVSVDIPNTRDIVAHLNGNGGRFEGHVTVEIAFGRQPNYGLLVFVNTPDADADTPVTSPGFVGAVAFFGGHHGQDTMEGFRLPATGMLARTKRDRASTITVVPVAYPGRAATPQDIEVTVALELVDSKVTLNK